MNNVKVVFEIYQRDAKVKINAPFDVFLSLFAMHQTY